MVEEQPGEYVLTLEAEELLETYDSNGGNGEFTGGPEIRIPAQAIVLTIRIKNPVLQSYTWTVSPTSSLVDHYANWRQIQHPNGITNVTLSFSGYAPALQGNVYKTIFFSRQ